MLTAPAHDCLFPCRPPLPGVLSVAHWDPSNENIVRKGNNAIGLYMSLPKGNASVNRKSDKKLLLLPMPTALMLLCYGASCVGNVLFMAKYIECLIISMYYTHPFCFTLCICRNQHFCGYSFKLLAMLWFLSCDVMTGTILCIRFIFFKYDLVHYRQPNRLIGLLDVLV